MCWCRLRAPAPWVCLGRPDGGGVCNQGEFLQGVQAACHVWLWQHNHSSEEVLQCFASLLLLQHVPTPACQVSHTNKYCALSSKLSTGQLRACSHKFCGHQIHTTNAGREHHCGCNILSLIVQAYSRRIGLIFAKRNNSRRQRGATMEQRHFQPTSSPFPLLPTPIWHLCCRHTYTPHTIAQHTHNRNTPKHSSLNTHARNKHT